MVSVIFYYVFYFWHPILQGLINVLKWLHIILEKTAKAKGETQILGSNMSHELGAILLTETINYSNKETNKPV